MRNLAVVFVALVVVGAACGGTFDGRDGGSPEDVRIVVGEEPGYVPPAWPEPYVAVAVGGDDLPLVVFHDQSKNVVEYRRCADPGCSGEPMEGRVPVPDDLYLGWLQLTTDPSGSPLIVLEGDIVDGPPGFFLARCSDTVCTDVSWARFPGEGFPTLRFAPDGALVMGSTNVVSPDESELILRRCEDALCTSEISRAEIPVLPQQAWSVFVDTAGVPLAVSGGGTPDGDSGIVSVITCDDPTCSTHETIVVGAPQDMSFFAAAAAEQPALFSGGAAGVRAVTWPGSISEDPISVTIDFTPADDYAIAAASLGWGESPVVAYLRMRDIETEEETRQLMVGECTQTDCTTGALTVIAEGTDEYGLETNPAIAVAPNGDTVIAFHTCPPGCSPQSINILRCPNGCAAAFPDSVESTWSSATAQ